MPSTGIGVYPGSASAVENDEVSSTYEGRHLTFLANDITGQEHTLVTKGHPVVIGEHIVGVAFMTEVLGTDLIPIDTEGIWNLMVYPKDDLGAIDVVAGDELWINKSNAEISKIRNTVTHTRFGYALGGVTTGVGNEVIAVKVHWDGDDELEQVGLSGAARASAEVSRVFRKYYYQSTGGSYPGGECFDLVIPSTSARVFGVYAKSFRLEIPGDEWICTGFSTVLELLLKVTAGDVNMGTWGVLTLDFDNENTMGMPSHAAAYITLRDRSVDLNSQQMNNIFDFMDIGAGVANANNLLCATSGGSITHQLKFRANGVHYWLMVTNTAPAA